MQNIKQAIGDQNFHKEYQSINQQINQGSDHHYKMQKNHIHIGRIFNSKRSILVIVGILLMFMFAYFNGTEQNRPKDLNYKKSVIQTTKNYNKNPSEPLNEHIFSQIVSKIQNPELNFILSKNLQNPLVLQLLIYYDINFVMNQASQNLQTQRIWKKQTSFIDSILSSKSQKGFQNFLKIQKTEEEIQAIIGGMMKTTKKNFEPKQIQIVGKRNQDQIDSTTFYFQLKKEPDNPDYHLAQYYYLNKKYNIGQYSKQLPICIVLLSKGNSKTIQNLYRSLSAQNYSNYKVVHIDDNSQDSTLYKTVDFLQNNKEMALKTTLIFQSNQRNLLYNLNLGIRFCGDDDIVVELQADDWLIGRQSLQLINSVYQAGKLYKSEKQEVWCAYFDNLKWLTGCCPFGEHNISTIQPNFIESHINRKSQVQWRTTKLRTYLKKLYEKINKKQFVDKLAIKKGQFYVQGHAFVHSALIQMSQLKHMKIMDETILYSSQVVKQLKNASLQLKYSIQVSRMLDSYNPLYSLQSKVTRSLQLNPNITNEKMNKSFNQSLKTISKQITKKRLSLKSLVIDMKQMFNHLNSEGYSIPKFQKQTVFNRKNTNKSLGQSHKFYINVSQYLKGQALLLEQYGMFQAVQVGSSYDYINFSKLVNMSEVTEKLFGDIAYEVLQFNFNQSLELKKPLLQYKQFLSQIQIQTHLNNVDMRNPNGGPVNDIEYYIGSLMGVADITQKSRQLQYYYYNKKYKIGQNAVQAPICIFAGGYKLFTQNRYKKFFNSAQRLNYSNFHIVYVDDNSPDNSAYHIYEYLQNQSLRVKNRVKIIHNLQHLGIMANMHQYIKHYCGPDDIVIICDGDDSLIGIQSFHILNSVYQDPDAWFVYTRFLMKASRYNQNQFWIGPSSKPMKVKTADYRTSVDVWTTSHMRTFRKKVMDGVPLQHFIQYHVNKTTGLAWPRYYGSSADRFQVYSHLQLCGDKRTKFITPFLYNYDANGVKDCYRYHEMLDQFKSRVKYPLKPLQQLGPVADFIYENKTLSHLTQKIKQYNKLYKNCQ